MKLLWCILSARYCAALPTRHKPNLLGAILDGENATSRYSIAHCLVPIKSSRLNSLWFLDYRR